MKFTWSTVFFFSLSELKVISDCFNSLGNSLFEIRVEFLQLLKLANIRHLVFQNIFSFHD